MLIKEIYVKNPFIKGPIIYKNIETEDSTEFKGFIRVKLLEPTKASRKDSVFFLTKIQLLKLFQNFWNNIPPAVKPRGSKVLEHRRPHQLYTEGEKYGFLEMRAQLHTKS